MPKFRPSMESSDRNGVQELERLFAEHRDRLGRMVRVRMDPRLHGRIDPSDVIQEAYLEAHRRRHELVEAEMPAYLWLRLLVGQNLVNQHRFHLGVQKRSPGREMSLEQLALPEATSESIALQFLDRNTPASQAAMRAELRLRVEQALNDMDGIDREVLVLRQFESLTNAEAAQVLGISPNATSNRYVRALKRLREVLGDLLPSYGG